MTNDTLEAFIARAGFQGGWSELESWARRMAEQSVKEQDALMERAVHICRETIAARQPGWIADEYAAEFRRRLRIADSADAAPKVCPHYDMVIVNPPGCPDCAAETAEAVQK